MKSKKLFDIRKESLNALYYDNRNRLIASKWKLNLLYYGLPIFISTSLILLNQKLTEDSITYFITGISIFAGLFFNLLIVVSEKMDKRKKQLESDFEPTSNYANDYKLFSERLIASISYAIILSILVIGLMFFTQIDYENLDKFLSASTIKWINNISDYTFNFLAYFVGLKFLILLVHILIDIYDMLIHDMNLQQHQKDNE
tara:strand:- start:116 stop:718 length:603 start_codon:yes stop_codon:yes gene_type:complete